ncbi:hypothetical protein V8G54_013057 [Vigna mungo]|uniref:Uncharacterized protein n=1 Tax=Vigna mungo TaxID=3915 RepID=A0AAQ3NSA0_VIGMU
MKECYGPGCSKNRTRNTLFIEGLLPKAFRPPDGVYRRILPFGIVQRIYRRLSAVVAVDAASGVGVAAWAELVVAKGGDFRCVRRASRGRVSVVKRTLGQKCGVRRQSSSRRFRLWYEKLIYPFALNCLLYTLLRRVINLIQVFQEEDPMRVLIHCFSGVVFLAEKRRRKSGKHKKSMECVVMQGKKIERLEYK